MRKEYEIPTVEKVSFKVSDSSLCVESIIVSGPTNDGAGTETQAIATKITE